MKLLVLGVLTAFFLAFVKCSETFEEISSLEPDVSTDVINTDATEGTTVIRPLPIMPANCSKILNQTTECNESLCWVQADVDDCILLQYDLANITMSIPGADSDCKPEDTVCVEIIEKTHVTVYGTVKSIPQTVFIIDQEGYIKLNVTIDKNKPSLVPPVYKPDKPLDPSNFPDNCTRIIKSMNQSDNYYWTVAERGDCVQMTIPFTQTIKQTEPLYDPYCTRSTRICPTTNFEETVLNITGTLYKVPYIVSAFDDNLRTMATWNFLPAPPTSIPTPPPESKYPEGCSKVVKNMTCNGIPCWIQAGPGECVQQSIGTSSIAMTLPEPDPKCDPNEKICVVNRNGETIEVRGKVHYEGEQVILVADSSYVRMLINVQKTMPDMNKPNIPPINTYLVSNLPQQARARIAARLGNSAGSGASGSGSGSGSGEKITTTSSSAKIFAALSLVLVSVVMPILA